MKHLTALFYFFILGLSFASVKNYAQDINSLDKVDIKDVIGMGVIEVAQLNGKAYLNQKSRQSKLKVGDSFFETSYIETRDDTFVTLILPNNSIMYLGPDTSVKLHELTGKKGKETLTFEIIKGRIRMVGYKGQHYVKSPKGALYFSHADLEWDVYRVADTIVSEVKKYSGEIVNKNETVQELKPKDRPEINVSGIDTMNKPWERWLGKTSVTHDYGISYIPRFNQKKKASRAIASVESSEMEIDADFILMDEGEEESYSYPVVSKEIYVHENFFDYILIHVQKAAKEKAEAIVKSSYSTAAKEIVWEVASRSLIRWGTQYAQKAALNEIPKSLKSMYKEIEKRDINFKKSRVYVDSVRRVSQFKSYITAKNTVKDEGARRAVGETQTYLLALTKQVITPPVQYQVYLHAKEKAQAAADSFLKKSELIKTKDVDNLVEYLSQVAAKRFTGMEIKKIEEEVSFRIAYDSVVEASQRGADKIATFVADRVSERTAQLFNKMLNQEVAERAARNLASENKTQLGENYKQNKKVEMIH